MPYFLKHYFDPYYDYMDPAPRVDAEGHADNFSLGYVHNVVKGQVLAELIPFEKDKIFPISTLFNISSFSIRSAAVYFLILF